MLLIFIVYLSLYIHLQAWCDDKEKSPDGPLVYDTKLAFFLEDHVMKRGRKLKKKDDGTPIPLGRESVLQYVKAIKDIWISQHEAGFNNYP